MDEITNWVTPLYAGLLGLLLIGLAFNVSRYRVGLKISSGDGDHPGLRRAIRAHGNLTENAPIGLILLAAIEAQGFSEIVIHMLGSALIIGRVLHAFGLARHDRRSTGRALGILLTWLIILAASLLAVYSVIFPGRF
jgi:uncharacterized membrane protein YecN with MAPEG domain